MKLSPSFFIIIACVPLHHLANAMEWQKKTKGPWQTVHNKSESSWINAILPSWLCMTSRSNAQSSTSHYDTEFPALQKMQPKLQPDEDWEMVQIPKKQKTKKITKTILSHVIINLNKQNDC